MCAELRITVNELPDYVKVELIIHVPFSSLHETYNAIMFSQKLSI